MVPVSIALNYMCVKFSSKTQGVVPDMLIDTRAADVSEKVSLVRAKCWFDYF